MSRKGASLEIYDDRGTKRIKQSYWDSDKGIMGGSIRPLISKKKERKNRKEWDERYL